MYLQNRLIDIENKLVGWPREMVWGGRWEGASGWGAHAHPWRIHGDVWQNQGCSLLRWEGFSLRRLLLLQAWVLSARASVVVVHRLGCPETCGFFQTRVQICVPNIGRQIVTHWTTLTGCVTLAKDLDISVPLGNILLMASNGHQLDIPLAKKENFF